MLESESLGLNLRILFGSYLFGCVNLSKLLKFSYLNFLICKIGLILYSPIVRLYEKTCGGLWQSSG